MSVTDHKGKENNFPGETGAREALVSDVMGRAEDGAAPLGGFTALPRSLSLFFNAETHTMKLSLLASAAGKRSDFRRLRHVSHFFQQ